MKVMNFNTTPELKRKLAMVTGKEVEQIKKETLAHKDVAKFIKEYAEIFTDNMVDKGVKEFREYIKNIDNPLYSPRLKISGGNVAVVMEVRPEALERQQKAQWQMKLDLSKVSNENKRANFSDYDMSDIQRMSAFESCYDLVNGYEEGRFQVGLWLQGEMGIGKSYLMAATAKALNEKGAGVTMIGVNELIEDVKSQIGMDSDKYKKIIDDMKLVDVLILDDIGAESLTDWAIDEILFPILDWRYKKEKTTCFTSNVTKRDYAMNIMKPRKTVLDENALRTRMKRTMTRIDALCKEVQTSGQNRRSYY